MSIDALLPTEPKSTREEDIQEQVKYCIVRGVLIFVSDLPVSVEEPSPGSLCDLTRRSSPSLSLLTPSPSFSPFPALRRRYNGWPAMSCPLTCPPHCSPAAEVGGTEEVGAAPWRKGVEG